MTAKRRPPAPAERRARPPRQHLGQRGQLAADGGQVGQPEQVARRDAQQLAPLPAAQRPAGSSASAATAVAHGPVVVERAFARELVGIAQRVEQRGVGDDRRRQRARRARAARRAPSRSSRSEAGRARRRARDAPRRSRVSEQRGPDRASAERSMTPAPPAVSRTSLARRVPVRIHAVSRILHAVPRLRVAAAQLNLVVGDLDGNVARMLDAYERAEAAGCDLVAFPELARHRATRPRTCCCGRRSSPQAARGAREGRRPHRPDRGRRRLPDGRARPLQRGRGVRGRTVQGVYRKHLLPELRACSTSSATSRPSTVDGPLFVVAGVRVGGRRSARTRGARPARSPRRPRAAPSSSSTSTPRRTTRAGSHERETMLADARRRRRRCPSST